VQKAEVSQLLGGRRRDALVSWPLSENLSGLTDFLQQARAEPRKTLFRPSDYRLCAAHALAARLGLRARQDVQRDPHRTARSARAC